HQGRPVHACCRRRPVADAGASRLMVLPIDTTTGENLDRIVRIFARFTTVGYVAYSVMLAGSVIAWSDRTAPWWTPVAVVLAFGTGLVPGVLSFRDDVRA